MDNVLGLKLKYENENEKFGSGNGLRKCPVSTNFSVFNLVLSPSHFRSIHQALQRLSPLFAVNERDVCEERGKFQLPSLHIHTLQFSVLSLGICNNFVNSNNVLACRILLLKACHLQSLLLDCGAF